MTTSDEDRARLALNRFGLGRFLNEELPKDPRTWLLAQLRVPPTPPAITRLPSLRTVTDEAVAFRTAIQNGADSAAIQEAQAEQRKGGYARYRAAVNARVVAALQSDTPFYERLVHFWANHFCVSADIVSMVPFVGSLEFEAIRPHVMGRFEDLLVAVERHPAMLVYLNQSTSVGPNSRIAKAPRRRQGRREPGLNENLAREILELHTLGVRSGYTQADVTELARALTGWSLDGDTFMRGGFSGDFRFRPEAHEPGSRTIIGKSYDQPGEEQAHAVLRDLAIAPATAKFVTAKLARHFAGEDASAELQAQLAQAFLDSGGDLPTVYRALIDSPEVWSGEVTRFKSPWEWTISCLRALGVREPRAVGRIAPARLLDELGQPAWRPGSPAGWPDTAATWAAPDAIMRRVEAANRLVTEIDPDVEPRDLASQLLGDDPGRATRRTIEGADSKRTALTLVLLSPRFMRS